MENRDQCVRNGVEILCANRRKGGKTHTFIDRLCIIHVVRTAVNRDIVSALDESRGKFFSEGFEPTIVRSNASRADNRQLHELMLTHPPKY